MRAPKRFGGSVTIRFKEIIQRCRGCCQYAGEAPQGLALHRAWADTPDVRVVAVADEDPARAPEVTDVKYTRDWRDLIRMEEVEIVSVATPPSTHVELACAAMEAGRHVLVEKPLATSLVDAQQIIDTRDRTGCIAAVDYMLRFNPIVEALAGWVEDGVFGTLRRAVVENYAQDETLPPDHWFWDESVSGGILVEHAVHFIDIVNTLARSRIVRVDGVSSRRESGQVDQVLATVVYGDGLIANHYHEFARPQIFERTSMRLVFDLAELDILGWIPLRGSLTALTTTGREPRLHDLPGFMLTGRVPITGGEAEKDVTIQCGGKPFAASAMVMGTFDMAQPKLKVYSDCLRDMMADIARAIDDPAYKVRVPLEAGYDGLKTALRARESGKMEPKHI